MKKEHTGLWIPKEILARKDLTHVEKMVWAMARALPEGLKMADSTIAEQLGVGERYIAKVLSKLVERGMLRKIGSHSFRAFFTTTPTGVINYTPECNQLHPEVTSTTPIGDHKAYKPQQTTPKEQEGFDAEAWEAQRERFLGPRKPSPEKDTDIAKEERIVKQRQQDALSNGLHVI